MKKIYAIAAGLLLAAGAQAQTLQFFVDGKEVTPNSTVEYTNVKIEDYGEEGFDYEFKPLVELVSSTSGTVTIIAESKTGEEISMCCGLQCETAVKVVKTVQIAANSKLDLQFEHLDQTLDPNFVIPTVKAEISAKMGAVATMFTLVMSPDGSSVTLIEGDADFRAVNGGFEYNLDGAAQVSLYNITGAKAGEWNVNGNGTISTEGLQKGVYVYTVSGASNKSGKVYVK